MNETRRIAPPRRRPWVLRWAAALLLIAAGTLAAWAQNVAPENLIVPGVSVGPIKLGDTRERVESVFGKPDLVGWTQTKEKDFNLEYHKLNLYFNIHQGRVHQIFVLNDRYRTSNGLGVGSSLDEVQSGMSGEARQTQGKAGPELLFPSGIRFLFLNDRTLGIEVRSPTK